MDLIKLDDLKLKYQELSDSEKFIKFAMDYGDGAGINRYQSAQSYWSSPKDTDGAFPDLYEYHFPLFFQTHRELQRIFGLRELPMWELYATICAATAYKNMPHVMLLWERRRHHGLKDHTLNTHELLDGVHIHDSYENSNHTKSKQMRNMPDNLKYTIA